MPDPRLKDAMKKIVQIMQKYGIGGAITLVSKTHAEYRYEFPHWSVVQPETGPNGEQGIRLRSFKEWYGDKEQQREAAEQSLHCLYQIRDLAGQAFVMFDNLINQVEDKSGWDIDHHPFSGHEPHEEEP